LGLIRNAARMRQGMKAGRCKLDGCGKVMDQQVGIEAQ